MDRIHSLPDRRSRRIYWVVRIAIVLLGLLAILLFGIQQHPQLH